MTLLHLLTVALVQGITEFLPISSQAHLILIPRLTDWCDQGQLIDIAVHVGTLIAVMGYFWRECWSMLRGAGALVRGRLTTEGRLTLFVIIATIPVIVAGVILKEVLGVDLRSVLVIGWTTIGFAVLLWAADRWGLTLRRMEHLTMRDALVLGCAQALALAPGTSRSGITITAARMLGFERTEAARFSMLMAIPVIVGAGTLIVLDLIRADDPVLTGQAALAGGLAFVSALAAIALLMRWLRHATFTPFIVYRLALGVALLVAAYGFGLDATASSAVCTIPL